MVGEAIVKRGGVRAVESGSTASKYKEYGADRVQGSGQAMAVAQHGSKGEALHVSKRVILSVRIRI